MIEKKSPVSGVNDTKKIIKNAKILHYLQKKKYYLYAALVIFIFTILFNVIPSFDLYKTYVDDNQARLTMLEGVPGRLGLRDQEKQTLRKMRLKRDHVDKENKDLVEKLQRLMPEEYNMTDIVRLFEGFAYSYNYDDNPFEIKSISFDTYEVTGNYAVVPIKMDIQSSKRNFERFLALMETSGSLGVEEILSDNQKKALEGLLTKLEYEELLELLENDFSRFEVIEYIEQFEEFPAKYSLVNDLFVKALFFKEYKNRIEERYYPLQLMSIESFTLRILDEEDKKSQELGSRTYSLKMFAYFKLP